MRPAVGVSDEPAEDDRCAAARSPSPISARSAIRASSRRRAPRTRRRWYRESVLAAGFPDGQLPLGRPALPGHRHRHEHRPRHGLERDARPHLGSVLVRDLQRRSRRSNSSRACTTRATRARPIAFDAAGRADAATTGRASLTSLWATAPYLHNNSVGVFIKDPSVSAPDGRVRRRDGEAALAREAARGALDSCNDDRQHGHDQRDHAGAARSRWARRSTTSPASIRPSSRGWSAGCRWSISCSS